MLLLAAGGGTIVPADLVQPGAPRFEDYPVAPAFSGPPHEVNLNSHRDAGTWRRRLREGARRGPNFADHFALVTWGCGTDCTQVAVVDVANGAVHFPPALDALAAADVDDAVFDGGILRFRRDSRLLIAVGMPNGDPAQRGVSYYEWTGADVRLVFRVRRARDP